MSVGQKLRQARESKGLTVQQVAAQTKISSRYLQAIEADDPKSLPGAFFYKSFVQQYANSLGVPMEELRWELDRVVPPPERTIEEEKTLAPESPSRHYLKPEPVTSRMGFRIGLLVVMLVACSAVYALWDRMQRMPAAEATTKPAASSPAPSTQKPPEPKPAEVQTLAPPAPSAAPAATPTAGTLVVAATEPAWCQVKVDGKVAYVGVVQPNETKNFDHFETASLLVGNAGGLTVTFNGKPVGEIGPRGQVRTVNFTPDKFEIQQPAPKKEEPAP